MGYKNLLIIANIPYQSMNCLALYLFLIFIFIESYSNLPPLGYCTPSYIERSNILLSTFDFNYYGFNQQTIDLSNNLIFYLDEGPFSANESVYIQISEFSIPNLMYSMLTLKANVIEQAYSTIFSITSNINKGVNIENTNYNEFSIKIDSTVDISKMTLLISRLGVVSKQEVFYENDGTSIHLYSDIFKLSPVENLLDDKIDGEMCEYSILNNQENSLMTIYKVLQNSTCYRGVSQERIKKIQKSIILESVCEIIKEKLEHRCNLDDPTVLFDKYITFLKCALKVFAFAYETHDIPLILHELNHMKIDDSDKLIEILEICYRRISLRNEDLEKQILEFF